MGSNIPLPALDVRTQFPNPLDEYMRAVQLKGAQQEQQLRAGQQQLQSGQIEQQQMELQDQRTLRSLAPQYATKDENGKVTGFDTDGYFNAALQGGVNPQKIAGLKMQQAEMAKNLAEAGTKQLDLNKQRNDQAYQISEGIRDIASKPGADPQQVQAAYQNAIPKIRQLGIDVSEFPAQFPGTQALDEFEAHLGVHKQIIEDAKTLAATKESTAKTAEAEAGTSEKKAATEKTQIETEALKQFGGLTPQMIEAKYISEMQKPQGQRDQKFLNAVKNYKEIVPQFNLAIQNPTMPTTPGGGTDWAAAAKRLGMTPEALDAVAERWQHAGQLPPIGRGGQGQAKNQLIMNYAADKYKGESLTEGSAEYAANKKSLEAVQKNFDQVNAFENTAGKNLDNFLAQAKNVVDFGSPLINLPLRKAADLVVGSENQAAFDAARTTGLTEIAKVLSSANAGSGVLSDSARGEVSGLIKEGASLKQIYRAAQILRQDMQNRHDSYQDQITAIQNRMKSKTAPATNQPAAAGKPIPGGKAPRNADGTINWKAYDQ